jgi:putative peptide zinc metalloprotease protein
MLNRWSRSSRRLTDRGPVLLATVYALATLALLCARVGDLAGEVRPALAGAGLLGLAAAFAASAVFHEGGHALACHRYAVGVERIGIGLRWLVPFAWTRPDQDAWRQLPGRARVVTAVAGPLGSLLFAALGGTLWYAAHDVEALRLAGLYSVVAGTVGMAPTLVPTFEGDAYLLLEMWLGRPNLRQRSFEHLLGAFTGTPRTSRTRRGAHLLYVAFALTSALLCAAATCCVLGAVYWFAIAPLGGW